jgi:diguanylate cyclase (GGDEF)-like protein/putative nucleotidyltransferase with HDIG domain/PAS domain S-box-containing protein
MSSIAQSSNGHATTDFPNAPSQPEAQSETRASSVAPAAETRLDQLSTLLDHAQSSEPSATPQVETPEDFELENHLAQVRLGMASSLFTALRCKDSSTAAHSMRVALKCSAWALAAELPDAERDALEVAALLHDIGKLGIPDCILLKPAPLTPEERAIVERHQALGLEILHSCCASPEVLEMVWYASAWFDGRRRHSDRSGDKIPRGARMLSIVDAFDSMTTPQVYRAAMSADQAIKELCDFAGTQFDPQLVYNFAQLHLTDPQKLHQDVARRWLHQLDPNTVNAWWNLRRREASATASPASLHQQRLLENMYDGVIFLDANLQVVLWNRGAERITGITGQSITQRPFAPSVVKMRDQHGAIITDDKCPVAHCLKSGVQSLRRLIVRSRNGQDLAVDAHMIPVVGTDGTTTGISLQLHDASGEASLEERCHSLYEQAIRDPLTELANRAEFDRVHTMFVDAHLERRLPCSLIICDIDHFKQVNDNYGHPAGDEVIKSFAQLLKSACRPGDLSARYGGEEFVLLCADCNNAAAEARAEQVRKAFNELGQPALSNKCCSASFGVSEIQPGDTAETMLNRADRALLLAKSSGRNMVVQLGSGMQDEPVEPRRRWRFWQSHSGGPLLKKCLVTNVPLDLTVEKLRGFCSDHHASVTFADSDRVDLVMNPARLGHVRRKSDRAVPLIVELRFAKERRKAPRTEPKPGNPESGDTVASKQGQTCIQVLIRAKRSSDRRRSTANENARHVLASLRSYLMAGELAVAPDDAMFERSSSNAEPTTDAN